MVWGTVFEFGDIVPMRETIAKRRAETLEYVQSMLGQLRTMAQAERCDMLGYLIEMAYVEASDIIRGDRPAHIGPPSSEQLTRRTG